MEAELSPVTLLGQRYTPLGKAAILALQCCNILLVLALIAVMYDRYASCQFTGIDGMW